MTVTGVCAPPGMVETYSEKPVKKMKRQITLVVFKKQDMILRKVPTHNNKIIWLVVKGVLKR